MKFLKIFTSKTVWSTIALVGFNVFTQAAGAGAISPGTVEVVNGALGLATIVARVYANKDLSDVFTPKPPAQ